MAELLVSLACYTGKGCAETAAQYYDQNPGIEELIRAGEKSIKEAAHPFLVQYAAPIAIVAYGKEASIKLGAGCSLKYVKSDVTLMFRRDF